MDINIDPKEVEKYLANKLIESSIGPALERVINENVSKLTTGYQNPIEPVVKKHIGDAVHALVQEKYKDKITEMVRAKVTDEFLATLINDLWDTFKRNY